MCNARVLALPIGHLDYCYCFMLKYTVIQKCIPRPIRRSCIDIKLNTFSLKSMKMI